MKINNPCSGTSPAPRERCGANPYVQPALVTIVLVFIAWMTRAGLDVTTAANTAVAVMLVVVIVTNVNVSAVRAALLRVLGGAENAA